MQDDTLTAPERTHVKRFRFASFDEKKTPAAALTPPTVTPAPVKMAPEPPPPPAPPLITEKDVQLARQSARDEGYKQGHADAKAAHEQQELAREEAIKNQLEVIANRITMAAETHSAFLKGQQETLGKLVVAVARKVAGDALKREPYTAVESLLRECIALIAGEPRIAIAVAPALAAGLRQRLLTLKPLLGGFEGELAVEEDAALSEQDCRVEWKSGYAESKKAQLWSDIEAIIVKTPIT